MSCGGSPPAGSSRALRLDPFALPARFSVKESGAEETMRQVELHRERVVLRRSLAGMRMAVNLPVAAYRGVAMHMTPSAADRDIAITIVLEHRDPGLSIPLLKADDGDDVIALWHAWARVLGLPVLVADDDGHLSEPFARIGAVRVNGPTCRRRRRTALKRRRPSILLRRKPGVVRDTVIHRGVREIIART